MDSAYWDDAKIREEVRRAAGRGLRAGAIFLTNRLKELLSESAPRKRVLGKRGKMAGLSYYRATTRALTGAPPRKLSGRFRASQTYEVSGDGLTARIGNNAVQGRRLEDLAHPYLSVLIERFGAELGQIIGGAMQS